MIQYIVLQGLFPFLKEVPAGETIADAKNVPKAFRKERIRKDLAFLSFRTGMPNKNSSYDTHLYRLCKAAGLDGFGMHALRHTYTARAIERGMQPKTLQKLLGHSSLNMTMDRYVHVTDDSLENGVRTFEMGQLANGLAGEISWSEIA